MADSQPYGVHQFSDRVELTGWFGKLVDLIGRDRLRSLHENYGPLPDFERPKGGYRARIVHLVKENIKAGFTVSLVSIPLALSLAIASSATPNMGLASAIWGGLIAALLGGSQYNISGPTASGAGILAVYSLRYGYQILPFISILSGIFCLIALALRLDKYVLLMPGAVMHGWTVGVAFIIAGNQMANAFGLVGLKPHEQFYLNIYEVVSHLGNTRIPTFITFLIAVTALVVLTYFYPTTPWTIIVAMVGILIGALSEADFWFYKMNTLTQRYQGLTFNLFQTPTFKSTFFTGEIITAAFSIAFISILETLLSAKIADKLTNTRFAQPLEVFGISIANIVAGIFNGVPVTAALARTALNIRSGANNRMAAVLNAVCSGVISILFIKVLGCLPLPIISALLVNVAIRMVTLSNLTHLWMYDTGMFAVAIFTALVTVFRDPATGIIVGAVVSIFLHARRNAEGWAEVTIGTGEQVIVSHTSLELDRQAIQDTFERQFPPTRRSDLSNQFELMEAAQNRALQDAPVPLDEDEDSDAELYDDEEEELHNEEQNRFFVTAPLYRGDHLLFRVPGELTYLNADQHTERMAPFLHCSRNFIIHLKQTYLIDMDGMDALTSMVNKVTKAGQRVWISGLTAQALPNLVLLDWFMQARDEGRIVGSYRQAIQAIADLDRREAREREEENYDDMTRHELEESQRHAAMLDRMNRQRIAQEEAARKVKEAEEAAALAVEAENAARFEAHKANLAAQQEAQAAKRKAYAEEFQQRLEEFERQKAAREEARKAYMNATSTSLILGEPSLTIPHHHDLQAVTQVEHPLKISEDHSHSAESVHEQTKSEHHQETESATSTTVHVHQIEDPDQETVPLELDEPEKHVKQEPVAEESQEDESTEVADSQHKVEEAPAVVNHVEQESNVETPSTAEHESSESTTPNSSAVESVEEESIAVEPHVEPEAVSEESQDSKTEELSQEPLPEPSVSDMTQDVEPATPVEETETEQSAQTTESSQEVKSEPEEEVHVVSHHEAWATVPDSETTFHFVEPLPASDPAPVEEPASDSVQEEPSEPSSDSVVVQEGPSAPSSDSVVVQEPSSESVSVDSTEPAVESVQDAVESVTESVPAQESVESESVPVQDSTESVTDSVVVQDSVEPSSDSVAVQESSNVEEPSAPVDSADEPASDSVPIPESSNVEEPSHDVVHDPFADIIDDLSSFPAPSIPPVREQAPISQEPSTSDSSEFIDPFAEILGVATEPTLSTPVKQPPVQPIEPTTPVQQPFVDFIDPFAEFEAFSSTPATPQQPAVASSVQSTPKSTEPAPEIDFDPFSSLLGDAPKSSNDDEELL